MPRTASQRARNAAPRADVGGFATSLDRVAAAELVGTVTLPAAPQVKGPSRATASIDLYDTWLAQRVTPYGIKAVRKACNSALCLDNRPGTVESDDRLANARPACCQAALDIDEPLYALSEMFRPSEHAAGHTHHHTHTAGNVDRLMAMGTAAAACVGIYYGVRNVVAARRTGQVLARMRQRVEARRSVSERQSAAKPQAARARRPLPERQRLRNDAARIVCLARAEGVHRFTKWHGALQVTNGAVLLGSVLAPAWAPVATGGMVLFCGMQAARYMMMRRATAVPARVAGHSICDAKGAAAAHTGADIFTQRQIERRRAFVHGALAHGAYGVGAALMTVATTVAGAGVLLWPGLVCLALGMVAVAATGKRCADHTFTSNSEADLGAENPGSKASMLRQIALLNDEAKVADVAAAKVPNNDTRRHRAGRAARVFLSSLVGREEQASAWAHRKRVAMRAANGVTWFTTWAREAGQKRIRVLQEEMAALADKEASPKPGHASDAASVQRTRQVLAQWIAQEQTWIETCRTRADDAPATAAMILGWLMSRRWHEEVISDLCIATLPQDLARQPWWQLSSNAEPRFHTTKWLAALSAEDPQAQAVWKLFAKVLADFMAQRQVEVTRNRVDALVNQLTGRLAVRSAAHPDSPSR